jgi:hypothetical protein
MPSALSVLGSNSGGNASEFRHYENGIENKDASLPMGSSPIRRKSRAAVILHLYYVDMWPYFLNHLARIDLGCYDLFVTLPDAAGAFESEIAAGHPNVRVLTVPNRGRDVFPFLKTLDAVADKGYQFLLKLHSKKSPHRNDGREWLDAMMACLLPHLDKDLKTIFGLLEDPDTAIIGPSSQYLSLLVNLSANERLLQVVLNQSAGREASEEVLKNAQNYGFFSGTMFWARVDALAPFRDCGLTEEDFPDEPTLIDGTLAHAMERAFTLVPQVNGKDLYQVDRLGVISRTTYSSGAFQDWFKSRVKSLEQGIAWFEKQNAALEAEMNRRGELISDGKAWVSELEQAKTWLEKRNQSLEGEVLESRQQFAEASEENVALRRRLDSIVNSRIWRIIRSLNLAPAGSYDQERGEI